MPRQRRQSLKRVSNLVLRNSIENTRPTFPELFSITDIPADTYQVQISAEGYQTETYEELILTIGVPQSLTVSLEQNAPEITNARADSVIIINNEDVQTTFHADITDPDGIADIQSVLLNPSDINSDSGNINMSLVDADTGRYEAVVTIPADTAARAVFRAGDRH